MCDTGIDCEEDYDACQEDPCDAHQNCTDIPADQQGDGTVGYTCSGCLDGFVVDPADLTLYGCLVLRLSCFCCCCFFFSLFLSPFYFLIFVCVSLPLSVLACPVFVFVLSDNLQSDLRATSEQQIPTT